MMKIFLTLFVLLFSSSVFAEDISDFEIEGISIGNGLLDYMSEEEIKNEIKLNKHMYDNLSKKFVEVYLYKYFENYDYLSFLIKPDDKKYKIYSIRGSLNFDNKINACYAKQKEVVEEIFSLFGDSEKDEGSHKHRGDPSGDSTVRYNSFRLQTGDKIFVQCYNFGIYMKNKYNSHDNLSVSVDTAEVYSWFNNLL